MSMVEIIAILGLLIALLQTMIAWMSHEGIRLSLSSGDWILLFINLMRSTLIVGVLSEASGESLSVFFVGSFLAIELAILLDDWMRKNGVLFCVFVLFQCNPLLFIPLLSHSCMIRSVVSIIKLLPEFCSVNSNNSNQVLISYSVFVFFSVIILPSCFNVFYWLKMREITNKKGIIIRLINFLTCGIGVCLGYWFRLIF